jgi:glycosyltransferase involved in cell wall biosynthesis
MAMTISVIVATYGRPNQIKNLLDSLLTNTVLPDEVIVVEQGDVEELKKTTNFYQGRFPIKTFFQEEKSASTARARGVKESRGEVLVFLDDDMTVGADFLEVVRNYLSDNPLVLGLTGSYMKEEPAWTLKRIIGVLFGVYSWQSRNVILPSGCNDYIRSKNLNKVQSVEWLYGGNMILRRSLFDEGFQFNPNFKKWSFGEDVMLTYKIYKKYPNSLYYLPQLVVKHNHATENKMLNEEVIRMKIIYRYIFWRQEVYNGKPLRFLAYVWSQIGLIGLDLLLYPSIKTFKAQIKSYLYIIHNHREIIAGEIDYNSFIFK